MKDKMEKLGWWRPINSGRLPAPSQVPLSLENNQSRLAIGIVAHSTDFYY